jgi:hypothetical protein
MSEARSQTRPQARTKPDKSGHVRRLSGNLSGHLLVFQGLRKVACPVLSGFVRRRHRVGGVGHPPKGVSAPAQADPKRLSGSAELPIPVASNHSRVEEVNHDTV